MEKGKFFQWVCGPESSQVLFISVKFRESSTEVRSSTRFAYWKAAADLPVHKLFLRDPHRSHYHHGVPGLAKTIYGIRDAVVERCNRFGIRRVVLLGASQGGYMALALGKVIEDSCPELAIEVLAYDPQTQLGYRGEDSSGRKWGLIRGPSPTPELMDLHEVFASRPPNRPHHCYRIIHGSEREDIGYAENLRRATLSENYCMVPWRRRLTFRKSRRKESVHGSEIVRENASGALRRKLVRAMRLGSEFFESPGYGDQLAVAA